MKYFLLLLLFFVTADTCFAGSFDDMMNSEVKKEEPTIFYSSKKLFAKQFSFTEESMKKNSISLRYLHQKTECKTFSQTFFPYANDRNGELFTSMKVILKNEYGIDKNIDDYVMDIVYVFDNMCTVERSKFTLGYLEKVNYDLQKEGSFTQEDRLNGKIERSISLIQRYLSKLKKTGELSSIKKIFDDYATALDSHLSCVDSYLDKTFQIYVDEDNKLQNAYTIYMNDPTVFPQQNMNCLGTILNGFSAFQSIDQITKNECSILELNIMGTACDANAILTSIAHHPVATLKNVIPLDNKTTDQVISTIEPLRKAAEKLTNICVFTK